MLSKFNYECHLNKFFRSNSDSALHTSAMSQPGDTGVHSPTTPPAHRRGKRVSSLILFNTKPANRQLDHSNMMVFYGFLCISQAAKGLNLVTGIQQLPAKNAYLPVILILAGMKLLVNQFHI